MLQDNLSRWTMQAMRGIGVAILILGIASLVFGIILLLGANTAHDEEVEQLEMELSPTSIDELKDLREEIRDNRHLAIAPEDVSTFIEEYIDIGGLLMTGQNTVFDDMRWEAWHSLLIQEKGTSVALVNLGHAQLLQYAGIGTIILSVGLIFAGLVAIILGPGISRMRTAIAELHKPSEEAPVFPGEAPSEDY